MVEYLYTGGALGGLAIASGIYTYLGMTSLLEDTGAIAYSVAVSISIFVFWNYMLRILPAMQTATGFIWLTISTIFGSLITIAMSSWLNAAALAGSAAVELYLSKTINQLLNRHMTSPCRVRRWNEKCGGLGSL